MTRIVACLYPDGIEELLRGSLVRSLKYFINFDTVEDALSHLWDSQDHVDFVVIDRTEFDVQDLLVSAQNRPQTRFAIVGSEGPQGSFSASNVVFVETQNTLRQALEFNW